MRYDEENINIDNDETINEAMPSSDRGVKKIILCVVSTCFFILWSYSAYVQINDEKNVAMWFSFYAGHAIVAGTFTMTKAFGTVQQGMVVKNPLRLACVVLCLWSIALMITQGIAVANAAKGDQYPGTDPKFNNRQGKVLSLSGAALTFASAAYHLVVLKYCM